MGGHVFLKRCRSLLRPRLALCAVLCSPLAFHPMPAVALVEVVKTIRQDGLGDYPTLAAWAAAKGGIAGGNLVAADCIAVARIEGSWTQADTAPVAITGWTTSPANYIKIFTAPDARHNGTPNSGYRLVTTSDLYSDAPFLRIEGLEICCTSNKSVLYLRPNAGPGVGDIRLSGNLIHGNGVETLHGIQLYSYSGVTRIYNNTIFGVAAPGYAAAILLNNGTNYVCNNTIAGTIGGFGIRTVGGVASRTYARNNLVRSSNSSFYGVFSSGSDYNACSDAATSGGPHDLTNAVFAFVDEANHNYHLSATDAGARDRGMNLRYDRNLPITHDIDGDPRYGTWDIGSDEVFADAPDDIAAPSTPGTPRADVASPNRISLLWTCSTDDTAVVGYRLYRNDTEILTVATNYCVDTGVVAMTHYLYSVTAFDAVGNESAHSEYCSLATPLPEDTTGPWIMLVKAAVQWPAPTVITWTTDEPAFSQVEYGTDANYGNATPWSSSRGVSHRFSLPTPLDQTTYHFRVRSLDSSGNESVSDDRTFIVDSTLGQTYFLNNQHCAASDSNPGTDSLPWLTLQHAVDALQPGDTLIVKPGNYGRVSITRGGVPGNYITIRGDCSPDMSHVDFQAMFDPTNPHQFPGNPSTNAVCRGFSLEPSLESTTSLSCVRIENFEITSIYSIGQPFPGRGGVYLAGRSANAPVEHVEVISNFFHDLNTPSTNYIAIRCGSHFTHNIHVQSNTIFRCQGTGITTGGSYWLVEENDVSHTLDANTDTGIEVGGDSDACRFMGHHHIFRHNYFHDCLGEEQAGYPHIDAFQTFSVHPDTQFAHDILIEANTCVAMGQMFMSEDGAEQSGATNAIRNMIVRNNIFRGARANAVIVGVDNFTFVNNVVAESAFSPIVFDADTGHHAVVANNLFYMNGSGPVVNIPSIICDYNLCDPDSAYPPRNPDLDKNSLFGVDPGFVDSPAGDYRLSGNSPAVDAGVFLLDTPHDRAGSARPLDGDNDGAAAADLGAYEFVHPTADTDGDRTTDADELIAGTDPADSNSVLSLASILDPSANEVIVSWPSAYGKHYTILGATSLLLNAEWIVMPGGSNQPGAGTMMSFTNNLSDMRRFFRIEAW